jgi:hypothetical protein
MLSTELTEIFEGPTKGLRQTIKRFPSNFTEMGDSLNELH